MTNQSKLKPCPFCGGEAQPYLEPDEEFGDMYGIRCANCSVSTLPYFKIDEAVKIWDRRVDNQEEAKHD